LPRAIRAWQSFPLRLDDVVFYILPLGKAGACHKSIELRIVNAQEKDKKVDFGVGPNLLLTEPHTGTACAPLDRR